MKDNLKIKNDYLSLKRKIFLQTLVITVSAIAIVLFLRFMVRGYFAENVIWLIERVFSIDPDEAQRIYQNVFRNNIEIIMFSTIIVILIVLFWFSITRLTRHFDNVIIGMNKLLDESAEEIVLSPELDVVEKKLNQVKDTLKKRTMAAKEAEQRKNDLVVYLAHDIKTPLTSVIGYLSLLEESPDMTAEQRSKYVGITLEKAYRLEELVNEFFDITRFNLQSIVLSKSKINLNLMLCQMADEFFPLLAPQNKEISIHISDEITLYGDADKLARVFNNILKNAVAYSFDNSTIDISAVRQDKNVILSFKNQGEQIPSEKMDMIFEKFYRLDTSRSSKTGGTGLGLSIAKEIVKAHGGMIAAESSKECTVFTVTLPAS